MSPPVWAVWWSSYVFKKAGGIWTPTTKILADDAAAGDEFGFAVSASAGAAIIGAHAADASGGDSGAAYFVDLRLLPFGCGCAGTAGVTPVLQGGGDPQAGGLVTLTIDGGVGGGSALLFVGWEMTQLALGSGCFLLVTPPLGPVGPIPLSAGGPGQGSAVLTPVLPLSIPTGTLELQAFVPDSGVPAGFSSTNGLEMNIL